MSIARFCIMGAGLALSASAASAGWYEWNWQVGDAGSYSINNLGGTFEKVHAEYHPDTDRFVWMVTFSDQITKGMTLAVNNGPNPKGVAGELALLYIDANNKANPSVTAYGYNGANNMTSYKDGVASVSGNQTPDKIMSKNDGSWLNDISVVDADGKRTFIIDIDASFINGHSPLYPDSDPWKGIGFAESLGLWMHPFRAFGAGYGEDGFLTSLLFSGQGYFDGRDFETTYVPTPGSAALAIAGAGVIGISRRRRSA